MKEHFLFLKWGTLFPDDDNPNWTSFVNDLMWTFIILGKSVPKSVVHYIHKTQLLSLKCCMDSVKNKCSVNLEC